MAKGIKTGGRVKGTPNKSTAQVADILAKLKCDPIEGLARIANGEPLLCGVSTIAGYVDIKHRPTLSQRLKAYTELAEYAAAKRKALELSGQDGTPAAFTINIGDVGDRS